MVNQKTLINSHINGVIDMSNKTDKMQADLNKRFIQYVAETKTEYKYTLKFAVPAMTEGMIDCIETALKKYELKEASAFKETPIQENPLDFANIRNMPVFIAEITMGYPSSLDFLQVLLGNALGVSTGQIAVYSENDPRQIETDLFLERSSPDFKKDYVAVLDPNHPDYNPVFAEAAKGEYYGESYNTPFLQELARVKQEREITEIENALSRKETVDNSTLPKGYNNFNDPSNLPKRDDNIGLFGRVKLSPLVKAGGTL